MWAEWFEKATFVDWATLVCAAVWALVKLGEWKRGVEARRNGGSASEHLMRREQHLETRCADLEALIREEHAARRRLADEAQVALGKQEVRLARGDVRLEEHERRLNALEERGRAIRLREE